LDRFVKKAHGPLHQCRGREQRGRAVVVDLQAKAFATTAYEDPHLGAGVEDTIAHDLR
jgi:hypothetical protein